MHPYIDWKTPVHKAQNRREYPLSPPNGTITDESVESFRTIIESRLLQDEAMAS